MLGRPEFAAREGGVVGERLPWWRWKLKSLGITPLDVAGEAEASSGSGPSFVQLEVPVSQETTERAELLELMLGDGRMLRIPAGFDARTLSRVLALLTRGEP